MNQKRLPVGIDDYKKLIDEGCYYVDKTLFIKELLDNCAEVNLFTRPWRFGKTLNLSMLQYFFEKTAAGSDNACLFDGKKIKEAGEIYFRYQGKYPVIRLSLKSGKQPDYEMSYASLVEEIGKEYRRHEYVLSGASLSETEKSKCRKIMEGTAGAIEYAKSLAFLSECLTSVLSH